MSVAEVLFALAEFSRSLSLSVRACVSVSVADICKIHDYVRMAPSVQCWHTRCSCRHMQEGRERCWFSICHTVAETSGTKSLMLILNVSGRVISLWWRRSQTRAKTIAYNITWVESFPIIVCYFSWLRQRIKQGQYDVVSTTTGMLKVIL